MFAVLTQAALADEREQAKRLHDRLAGVPATETTLTSMAADIGAGAAIDAAFTAMEDPAFYAVTLKNFAAPWTNRDQTVFVPLNDYIATVVGMIRDDVPFDGVLSADVLYVGDASLGLPPYSMNNNDHYQQIEDRHIDLKNNLVRTTQSAVTDLPAEATAGVMTTRAASEAFFVDGTNRAMFRFTLLNHLCHDLEQVKDGTRSPDRIRQDVSRSPGGDSRIFLNNCIACHSGMDPLAQAFAYYDFDKSNGRLVYTAGEVQPKYHINATNFSPGFITPDDQWKNYWRSGQNSVLGWDTSLPAGGNGAKSLGQELAASDAFAQCQVKKVFRNVCFREPSDSADRARIDSMVASLRANNYSLKQVFAESAVYCMGD
ncbi:MAG: hypothetical protein HKN70_13580 [Gammaproteobacteria bacterium]|nr:hypothetical protein [Gammaproteobacteria bacterium]